MCPSLFTLTADSHPSSISTSRCSQLPNRRPLCRNFQTSSQVALSPESFRFVHLFLFFLLSNCGQWVATLKISVADFTGYSVIKTAAPRPHMKSFTIHFTPWVFISQPRRDPLFNLCNSIFPLTMNWISYTVSVVNCDI